MTFADFIGLLSMIVNPWTLMIVVLALVFKKPIVRLVDRCVGLEFPGGVLKFILMEKMEAVKKEQPGEKPKVEALEKKVQAIFEIPFGDPGATESAAAPAKSLPDSPNVRSIQSLLEDVKRMQLRLSGGSRSWGPTGRVETVEPLLPPRPPTGPSPGRGTP